MNLCRITGSVHASFADPSLEGEKILVAQPLDLEGQPRGAELLAVDRAQAGEGDLVLVMKEGGGARIVLGREQSPVQCVVIAVVDDLRIGLE